MKHNKEQLLQNLFQAIEVRNIAEIEEEIANREMQAWKCLYFAEEDKKQYLELIRKHAEKEIELFNAKFAVDNAYDAYMACLYAEKAVAAND